MPLYRVCVAEFIGPKARAHGCRCECPRCAPLDDSKRAAANDREELEEPMSLERLDAEMLDVMRAHHLESNSTCRCGEMILHSSNELPGEAFSKHLAAEITARLEAFNASAKEPVNAQ